MLEVIEGGFLTTVQDLGRPAAMQWGVPAGGVMDRFSLIAANMLTGNSFNTAQIECFGEGIRCRADSELVVAGAGKGFQLEVDNRVYPLWMTVYVQGGVIFGLRALRESGWGILAVSGGINVPSVLGSCSTNITSGWGGFDGRRIEAGDMIRTKEARDVRSLAGRSIPSMLLPKYENGTKIKVILSSDHQMLTQSALADFFCLPYRISPNSNRSGYRLEGEPLVHKQTADILSEGTVFGTIQIPGDGQPVVLMSDAQPTGGYCKLGVVASASLPVLAQTPMETGELNFQICEVEEARRDWLTLLKNMQNLTWDENGDADFCRERV